jgi:hypothetical protein
MSDPKKTKEGGNPAAVISATVPAGQAKKQAEPSTIEKQGELQSMEEMLTRMMRHMDSVQEQFRSDFQTLNSKVDAMAQKENIGPPIRVKPDRRVSFGGGEAVDSQDDLNFESDSRRNSQRFSMVSESSLSQKDVGT